MVRKFVITISIILGLVSQEVFCQNSDSNTVGELSWSVVSTELEKEALAVFGKVKPKLELDRFMSSANGWAWFGTDIDLATGGNDSFERITAKLQGFYTKMGTDVDGDLASKERFQTFPFAIGLETERNLDRVSVVAEFGWSPIGQQPLLVAGRDPKRFGLHPNRRFGAFLQVGYKFDNANDVTPLVSSADAGNVDQSKEQLDDKIARVKAVISWEFSLNNSDSMVIIPEAAVWYDLVNSDVYHQASLVLRTKLFDDNKFWDLKFEDGSGPPNFNKGNQFSTGLVISF